MKEAKHWQEQEMGKLADKVSEVAKTADKVKEFDELFKLKKDEKSFVESLTEAIQTPMY